MGSEPWGSKLNIVLGKYLTHDFSADNTNDNILINGMNISLR